MNWYNIGNCIFTGIAISIILVRWHLLILWIHHVHVMHVVLHGLLVWIHTLVHVWNIAIVHGVVRMHLLIVKLLLLLLLLLIRIHIAHVRIWVLLIWKVDIAILVVVETPLIIVVSIVVAIVVISFMTKERKQLFVFIKIVASNR